MNYIQLPPPVLYTSGGMSLRDYFAAKAMQAIISKLPLIDQTGEFGSRVDDKVKMNLDVANSAYWYADAMLAVQEKEVLE